MQCLIFNRMGGCLMSSNSLMKGAAILTIGLFLSKALGLIYIFPFYAIIGESNVALYSYAYIPYSIMLTFAISGAPNAVAKFVAKYNTLGDYDTGRRLMRSGLFVMLGTGLISFIALFTLATPIAEMVIRSEEQVFTVEQIASVIRWLSLALLIVPFMSLWRGFFQGYGIMTPTAVSQLVEQIVRVAFLLTASFLVMMVFNGKVETAISMSVFAAFVGAVASMGVLFYYWRKHVPEFNHLRATGVTSGQDISMVTMYKEILTYSIPFAFVGMADPLFQLVDMLTFNDAMISIGLAKVTDDYFGMINFLTNKIVMIPVMLASGLSMALIPTITRYYTQGAQTSLRYTVDKTFQIILFVMLPATVGIMTLSYEIYYAFYSQSEAGGMILMHYAPIAILFALFAVTAALMQGIDYQKWVVFSLLTGIFMKLSLNIPMIKLFAADGSIIATGIGYSVAIMINVTVIVVVLNYRSTIILRRGFVIVLVTAAMAATVVATKWVLGFIIGPADTKWLAIVYVAICAPIGAITYAVITLKIGLAQKVLGERITRLTNKLGL